MDDLKTLSDEQQIGEVTTDLFVATDRRSWLAGIERFTPKVTLDTSSLGGAPAAPEIVALHDRPNRSGRDTRTFAGTHDLGLRRDGARSRVSRFRSDAKGVEGHLELER